MKTNKKKIEPLLPDNNIDEEPEIECPECGSVNIEVYFDPELSIMGESSCRCRDCENTWEKQ
jgi:hypothetical protein